MRVRFGQTSGAAKKHREKRRREDGRRQLVQLVVCAALFFAVYIGKGAFPERIAQVGPQLLGVIRTNTDFQAAFAKLGEAMTQQEPLLDDLGEFCVSVFGMDSLSSPDKSGPVDTAPVQVLQPQPLLMEEPLPIQQEEQPAAHEFQVGDVVEAIAVSGQQLPEHYTYDRLYLGPLETADPVVGTLTSAFGYRDHPTIGRYAVHGGVDIGAAKGTPVCAFADGRVETVGENDDFGLYLRLEHANGLTTFYSHCQTIDVQKGEQVRLGQQIARVGDTGQATGPHLHFEIQLGNVRLDPAHYITLQGS